MEMTLNQKIDWVKDLLSGQHSLWNRNDLYVPAQNIPANIAEHFWEILEKFEREGFVKKVEDVVKVGDIVRAKVIKAEDGRIGLSIKALAKG